MTNYRIDHPECNDDEFCQKLGGLFSSVLRGMLSLMMSAIGGVDWSEHYDVISVCGPVVSLSFLGFIIFFQLVFVNIVTSKIVVTAMKLAKPDETTLITERKNEEKELMQVLEGLFDEVDDDKSGQIDVPELKEALMTKNLRHRLEYVGIPVRDDNTFVETLTAMVQEKVVDKETFVKLCMLTRGGASGS